MKANDLMLGDYIISPINGISKIAEIYLRGVITDGDEACLWDEILPVSITPEILEKNGFEKWQVDYLLHIDESQYLDYYPHEASLERIYIHKDGSREVVFRVNAITYVHLLQHALKLCGIDKEILL